MGSRGQVGVRVTAVVVGVGVLVGLVGCSARTPDAPPASPSLAVPQSPSASTPPADAAFPAAPQLPEATDEPQDVVTGLTTPWSIDFLPAGAALVTLRDTAQVVLLSADGVTPLTGPGAAELAASTLVRGEGGLLGVAVSPDVAQDRTIYLYRTTADGNEVVRGVLDAAGTGLGALEPVLTGIPAASNHNGGRLAFGPDGHLYVATGDAGTPDSAQDPASLAGKILRITPDGDPAPGNPVEASPVWSLGHRNVQGLAWDADGTLLAGEFGQNTYDELNRIEPGGNYGWPTVEGTGGEQGFTDPLLTWSPAQASPSGIAVAGDAVHVAGLRGAQLWTVPWDGREVGEPRAHLDLGRLRDVRLGPDGALWVLTHNTDGRGMPRPGDDRVVRIAVP